MAPTAPKPFSSRRASPQSNEFDAIVLGAGISGLSAAVEMARSGMRVAILESRDRIGGRIHTIDLAGKPLETTQAWQPDSSRVPTDLGASFVHGADNNPLNEFVGSVPGFTLARPTEPTLLQTFRSNSHGAMVLPQFEAEAEMAQSCEVTFARLSKLSQDDPEWEPTDDLSLWDALEGKPSPTDPNPEFTRKKLAEVWEGISDVTRERILSQPEMWAGWCGTPISRVALRWWGSDKETVGDDAVVHQGFGNLVTYHALQLAAHAGQVRLKHRVTQLIQAEDEEGQHTVVAETPNGPAKYFANYVVCTLPLGVLKKSPPSFIPPLPKRKQSAIDRLGFGLLNKITLHYDTAWWAKEGEPENVDRWIELLDDKNQAFPGYTPTSNNKTQDAIHSVAQSYFHLQDYSSIHGHAVLMAFVPPPLAEVQEQIAPEDEPQLFAAIHQRLESALLPEGQKAPALQHAVMTRWRSDPHALGSYTYIPPRNEAVGQLASSSSWDMVELAQPLWDHTLRFAGEATHRDWFASVHGAWSSGKYEGAQLATMHSLRLEPKSSSTIMIP